MDERCEGCQHYREALEQLAAKEKENGIATPAIDETLFQCIPTWPDGKIVAGVILTRGYKENRLANPKNVSVLGTVAIGTPPVNCPHTNPS